MSENYETSSQATYYFDCKGDGTSKGSFCCILKRLKYRKIEVGSNKGKLEEIDNTSNIIPFDKIKSEELCYYILTAGHNIDKEKKEKTVSEPGSEYFLRKDSKKVRLELIKYKPTENDFAILKISDNIKIPNTISATRSTDFVKKNDNDSKNGNLVAYEKVTAEIKNGKYVQDRGDERDGKFAIIGSGSRGNSGGAIVYNTKVMGMYTNISGSENQAITIDYILKKVTEYEVV